MAGEALFLRGVGVSDGDDGDKISFTNGGKASGCGIGATSVKVGTKGVLTEGVEPVEVEPVDVLPVEVEPEEVLPVNVVPVEVEPLPVELPEAEAFQQVPS